MRSSHSLMFSQLIRFVVLGVAALGSQCVVAMAADPTVSQTSKTDASVDDARVLLNLVRAQNACKLPLDMTVENASVDDVAARIQKQLTTLPDAFTRTLPIVVRDVRPVQLSFAVKNSTTGDVLKSAATLAGGKLWVFPDHLLIAPEASLTTTETTALQKTMTDPAELPSFMQQMAFNRVKQKAFSTFVSNELQKAIPNGNKSFSSPGLRAFVTSPTEFSSRDNWNQLSPDAQSMVRELVNMSKEWLDPKRDFGGATPRLDLSTSVIGINPKDNNSVTVFFADTAQLCWQLDGLSSGVVAPQANSQPAKFPPVPSAGKS